MADALKAEGNAAFTAKDFPKAIDCFTKAIELDASNHVLFSNRSAAKASLEDYAGALEDAEKCVGLKPEWAKGYSRLGAAHHGLRQWEEAIQAYEQGLKLEPSNKGLSDGLQLAQEAQASPPGGGMGGGMGGMFGPEAMARLAMDPRTRPFLGQPDFLAMMQALQTNPGAMSTYMRDPRFQVALEVMLGIKMQSGDQFAKEMQEADDMEAEGPASSQAPPAPAAAAKAPPAAGASGNGVQQPSTPDPAPAADAEMSEEQQQEAAAREKAQAEKEAGNAAYKAKDFPTAIAAYSRAIELYDRDISFLTNRAAAHYEAGDFEACVADCDAAVERGRELRADYQIVAKALARKGNALVKAGRLEEAITAYNKSLTEHRNADTLKRLNAAEKALKEARETAYTDLAKSDEQREAGNLAFKEQRFPEAVASYQEALKRGPPAVNPEAHKLYSNLAACYTKLGAYPEGLKAAERCVELAPDFVKGHSRRANLLFLMKDYDKALTAYQSGLDLDPDSQELKDGMARTMGALNRFMHGDATEAEVKERQARAMADPEVQNILIDPVMRQVLQDLQEDPNAAQQHLRNPGIRAKITKLASAGVIQLR